MYTALLTFLAHKYLVSIGDLGNVEYKFNSRTRFVEEKRDLVSTSDPFSFLNRHLFTAPILVSVFLFQKLRYLRNYLY